MALALHHALRSLRLSPCPLPNVVEAVEAVVEAAVEAAVEAPLEAPVEAPLETVVETVLRKPVRICTPARPPCDWNMRPTRPRPRRAHSVDFNACCGDPEPDEPVEAPEAPEAPELQVTLPMPVVRVALSAEEQHLKNWFTEATQDCAEEFVWVNSDLEDSIKVHFSPERLREVGIESPSDHLFWIQDKPDEFADRFGHWDPVNARWRLLLKHTVAPIEQRIAPLGVGYGAHQTGEPCCDTDSFLSHEYNSNALVYKDTGLEPGLEYISTQLKTLPEATSIPATSGWGSDSMGQKTYYTPHLRHVFIDQAIQEEDGKRYVYHPGKRPVKPMAIEAEWSSANSCWVFSPERVETVEMVEREADDLLRGA